jgi:hypothetical protein
MVSIYLAYRRLTPVEITYTTLLEVRASNVNPQTDATMSYATIWLTVITVLSVEVPPFKFGCSFLTIALHTWFGMHPASEYAPPRNMQ